MTRPEFFFYHLETQTLQAVLPPLLEKTLSRGWKACLRFGTVECLDALDAALWTYQADSFLPHGKARDDYADRQPILLTTDTDIPNGATILFLLDGAGFETDLSHFTRIVRIFDGLNLDELARAREEWRVVKASGADVSYWRQDEGGVWRNHAAR